MQDRKMSSTSAQAQDLINTFTNLYRRWIRSAEEHISPSGLNLTEYRAIRALHDSGPCSMVELARIQMLTQAAMTSIVDELEEQGLTERIRSTTDRRVINVALTSKGEVAFKKGWKLHLEFIEKIVSNVGKKDIDTLVEIQEKMLAAVEPERKRKLDRSNRGRSDALHIDT